MPEMTNGFDWDAANLEKCCKHGVSIEEIESLFGGQVDVFPDVRHSAKETRFLGIGKTLTGRHVFIAFALRTKLGAQLIRPISARYMHPKEVRHYEAEVARRKN
jgi:uncharacterized DUF497 family protein